LVAGQVDGVFCKVLYDNAAIGGYIKVTGTTVTSANIAAECAKIYSVIPPENLIQYHQLLFMLQERGNN
jgi:hypothetical protein